jgi:DNA helicase-2/ATP-dependent DNA helicase PcrA
LCCVGDPNQAIYAWNGADPSLIERFADRVRGATVVAVDTSYRSSPQVLSVANAVLDAGRLGGVRLRAVRAEGPVPVVHRYPDDAAEAAGVARAVLDAHLPGGAWSQQAVLARTNALLEPIAGALAASGIPTRRDGTGRFSDHPAIRAALKELGTTAADLAEAIARLAASAEDETAADARVLSRLADLAEEYRRTDRAADAGGFRSWLVANRDDLDGGDGVALRTFHGAKGLEWRVVHIVGVEDGLVPLARAVTPEAEAEERRLLYVAITRAERVLRLSWSSTRSFGDDAKPARRRPSPYLSELAGVLRELGDEARPADGREHLATMRAVLAARRVQEH